jgi:phospholipid-binding lipoprotein MlaA
MRNEASIEISKPVFFKLGLSLAWRLMLACLMASLLGACALTRETRDPLENVNRKVFEFNDALDQAALKPVAKVYDKYTPQPVKSCLNNFFFNLTVPTTALNNLLQGKVQEACEDTLRFAFNTVFGLGGCIDIASAMGIEKRREDFGQTLARWGVPSGPYLVLPVFGPSTLRDALTDSSFASIDLKKNIKDDTKYLTVQATDLVVSRSRLLQAEGVVNDIALDRYSFIRDAFLQRRRSAIYDGNPPDIEEPPADKPDAKADSKSTDPKPTDAKPDPATPK